MMTRVLNHEDIDAMVGTLHGCKGRRTTTPKVSVRVATPSAFALASPSQPDLVRVRDFIYSLPHTIYHT